MGMHQKEGYPKLSKWNLIVKASGTPYIRSVQEYTCYDSMGFVPFVWQLFLQNVSMTLIMIWEAFSRPKNEWKIKQYPFEWYFFLGGDMARASWNHFPPPPLRSHSWRSSSWCPKICFQTTLSSKGNLSVNRICSRTGVGVSNLSKKKWGTENNRLTKKLR